MQERQVNVMSKEQDNLFTLELVYKTDGMKHVVIEKNLHYSNIINNELTMDVYYNKDANHEALKPVVIFVTGYPDPGFSAITGLKLKEVAQYISWAKLIAASGFIALTYTNVDPVIDLNSLLLHIVNNGATLGIDKDKICIWSCSGNTPNAMSLLMNKQNSFIKCAVLCYGYMPDVAESSITSDAARQFHFVNPAQHIANDLKTTTLIVRCGQEAMPGLNASIDKFVVTALARNLPITLINLPHAPHAFDIVDNSEYSHEAIKCILSFIKSKFET